MPLPPSSFNFISFHTVVTLNLDVPIFLVLPNVVFCASPYLCQPLPTHSPSAPFTYQFAAVCLHFHEFLHHNHFLISSSYLCHLLSHCSGSEWDTMICFNQLFDCRFLSRLCFTCSHVPRQHTISHSPKTFPTPIINVVSMHRSWYHTHVCFKHFPLPSYVVVSMHKS